MNLSTPGLPVHHQLAEFTETHIHRVSDAIQPSHPLSSPSPLVPNPSQHQSLNQRSNSQPPLDHRKSKRVPEKHLLLIHDYAKAFDCVDHNKLWKILKEMGIPDHLYAGQEATVRTGHGTTDWFQIGKGVHQGCYCHPAFFNLYAEYIMQNARVDEAQAGIKIAWRNVSNLRYADDTTLMVESEEQLKSLLMKVKEETEKVSLKCNIQKTKIMTSGPITSWQIDGETMETEKTLFLWAPKSLQIVTASMK